MSDYSELKRLAEAANKENAGFVTLSRFSMETSPSAVLALIADCESAHKHWENDSNNVQVLVGELAGAQAMLETAYSERDQLKDEVEAMRKDAERYRWLKQNSSGSLGVPGGWFSDSTEWDDGISDSMIKVDDQ